MMHAWTYRSRLSRLIIVLAFCGQLIPLSPTVSAQELVTLQPPLAAEEQPIPGSTAPRLQAMDVVLDAGGQLRGAVVDLSGQPRSGAEVVFRGRNQQVVEVKTGAKGQFLVTELRPGIYQVNTPAATHVVRVWAFQTAPPVARPAVLLVDTPLVVRGQQLGPWRRALILTGVIATSGLIGGVIGYEIKDDAS